MTMSIRKTVKSLPWSVWIIFSSVDLTLKNCPVAVGNNTKFFLQIYHETKNGQKSEKSESCPFFG